MSAIKSISCRKILNSHVSFTNEFIIALDDGSVGIGASPQGETISIYEDRKVTIDPQTIIATIEKDGLLISSAALTIESEDSRQGFTILVLKKKAPNQPAQTTPGSSAALRV